MTYVRLYPSRRRRRTWRPWPIIAAVLIVIMLVLMLPLPPWWMPPPPVPAAAPAGVGDLIHDTGRESAIVRGLLALPDGTVLAAVSHVRGQHGRTVYVVEGCPAGGVLREYGTHRELVWSRGGSDIASRVASVACRDDAEVESA